MTSSANPHLPPHLVLAGQPHERLGNHRRDQETLEQIWQDPRTRVLVIAGNRIRIPSGDSRVEPPGVEWRAITDLPVGGTRILLGEAPPSRSRSGEESSPLGAARFALQVDPEALDPEVWGSPEEWVTLRGAFPLLLRAPEDVPYLFHAIGLAEWNWATRFCPRCGSPLTSRSAGHELACTGCGRTQFPRTDPAVIMAITKGEPGTEDEALLLGHQASWPEDRWSTLAGFCEPGEMLEDAVRREVAEEVGVRVGEVTYYGNQPWPLPASLMIGFFGRAVSEEILPDGIEIDRAGWFTRADLTRLCEAGEIRVPRGVSISSSLMEQWYGGPLPGGGEF